MIEDQVLFHLPKFGENIFSLRNFPDPLKGHDEAVPQGAGFGSLKSVSDSCSTMGGKRIFKPRSGPRTTRACSAHTNIPVRQN